MAVDVSAFADILIHSDKYISYMLQQYGTATYILLFFIIFLETGIVITPFLPGDSLLFLAGTLAATTKVLNVFALFLILALAAILGDSVNYWIGKHFGKLISGSRRFKKEYLEKTESFYEKYGGKTIIIARFIPVVRTFAPFVAGVSKMNYRRFLSFNFLGGIAWVALFVFGGYYFGHVPFVQNNLTFVVIFIIFISMLPPLLEVIIYRARQRR